MGINWKYRTVVSFNSNVRWKKRKNLLCHLTKLAINLILFVEKLLVFPPCSFLGVLSGSKEPALNETQIHCCLCLFVCFDTCWDYKSVKGWRTPNRFGARTKVMNARALLSSGRLTKRIQNQSSSNPTQCNIVEHDLLHTSGHHLTFCCIL